jgi:hypothetical protein
MEITGSKVKLREKFIDDAHDDYEWHRDPELAHLDGIADLVNTVALVGRDDDLLRAAEIRANQREDGNEGSAEQTGSHGQIILGSVDHATERLWPAARDTERSSEECVRGCG